MSGWRYMATRLNGDGTETMLDLDLPLEEVSIDDVLSGDQALNGKIEPAYTRLIAPDGVPILREWGTAVYAEKDGEIKYGGILVASAMDGPTWELETVGYTGYWRDMPYTGSGFKGIRVDPIDCAREIINHVQAQPGGNLGLTVADTLSGKSIGTELEQVEFDTQEGPVSFEAGPYKLNWYSNHDLGGDIDTLALETPFDYHERHYWDGETIRHHLDIGYPAIGRRREDLRFVFGENVFEVPTIDRDGEQYASGTMVLGAGDGPSMIHEIREMPTRPTGRLRRIAVVSDPSIRRNDVAISRADAENQWRARIDDISSILVQDHKNAQIGAASVGDEILLEGRTDWTTYEMWVRILSISYEPANGGVAEYSVARADRLLS